MMDDRDAKAQTLIDAIPGGIVIIDPQGRITEVNQVAAVLLGEAVVGEYWRTVVQRVFLDELDQGELKTADGRQYAISTNPLGYAPGQILLLNDVTQTRQLQRAAQQNRHLMTMGKMMASLAHQLRTPLSSSMLYLSQLVASDMDEDTRHHFCEKALMRNKQIEKMVNDMLVFAHGGQFVMSHFAISQLLGELQEQLLPQIQQREATITITGSKRDSTLMGNRDALLGAFANLMINAFDACRGEPRVRIHLSYSRQGLLLIVIDDNGCGMDRNTRVHLFDPFYTTKTEGTGLGLAVVKSVIESHQGMIKVASRPRVGTRFRISLPCQQALKTQLSGAT